ncbi:hypothetical protein MK370_10860 [Streptococcus sanguinis]|uniref:hypothetical protein n=1 Tax=Streptococcus sanguinis TaxID=1305 RepID=UPI002283BE21|nr:hypothetical protein [Streptococcus sanguinis]MCY7042015.1 hypothetical protein [Streptococcus sanguinis]
MNVIIKALLSGVFYAVVSFLVKCYYLRQLVWENEYHLNGVISYMIGAAKWALRFIFLLTIYNMIQYRNYVENGIILFFLLLPAIALNFGQNKRYLQISLDKWFRNNRVKRFSVCPHCGIGNVFYREFLSEKYSDLCYFLITNKQELIYLGLYDFEQIARDFVDEVSSYERLISHYYPYLQVYPANSMLVDGEILEFGENCYCSRCLKQVNTTPVKYGVID